MMNLLLVNHGEENQHVILPDVVNELAKLGGPYRCRLVGDVPPRAKHRIWTLGLPTVVISMRAVTAVELRFVPSWATVWRQAAYDKVQECEFLQRAGIPVPKWAAIDEASRPDLTGFGEFVVVKPAHGSRGALVRVMRRDRVRWRPLEVEWHAFTDTRGTSSRLLVQEYVHTGAWPISYRVGTIFGEPIYAWRMVASQTRPPFPEGKPDSAFFDGRTIVATSKGCRVDDLVPQDVLQLARMAHGAFPDVPLLGTDIIRDDTTGKLYVLEVNSSGGTFHLTSVVRERILKETGIDLLSQFGGAPAVARGIHQRLVDASREWPGVMARRTNAVEVS